MYPPTSVPPFRPLLGFLSFRPRLPPPPLPSINNNKKRTNKRPKKSKFNSKIDNHQFEELDLSDYYGRKRPESDVLDEIDINWDEKAGHQYTRKKVCD